MKKLLLLIWTLACCNAYAQRTALTCFNLNPSSASSIPAHFYIHKNKLFFIATEATTGDELWSADKQDVIVRITDHIGGYLPPQPGYPNSLKRQKMASTATSIYAIATANNSYVPWPTIHKYIGGNILYPTNWFPDSVMTRIFFSEGNKIWGLGICGNSNEIGIMIYDTTANRHRFVNKLRYSIQPAYDIADAVMVKSKIVFTATMNTSLGPELVEYDTVTRQTNLVADIRKGSTGSNPKNYYVYNNVVYFHASDSVHGTELFAYDGINPPKMVIDLNPADLSGAYVTGKGNIIGYNNKIYFAGNKSPNNGLFFCYDIAKDSVYEIKARNSTYLHPESFTMYHNKLFFGGVDDSLGKELFVYDFVNPPVIASDVYEGKIGSTPLDLMVYEDNLYFSALDPTKGIELFKYNDSALVIPTSLQKQATQSTDALLYPNPAKDYATLSINLQQAQTLHICITDAHGRVVYNIPARHYAAQQHRIQLPVAQLAAGVYQYAIYNSHTLVASGKLVRE